MSFQGLFANAAFDPEAVQQMSTALSAACRALGLAETQDPVTLLLAARIIELARQGERDAESLRAAAVRGFLH